MVLDVELAYFEEQKAELLQHYRGQYALIYHRSFLGAYSSFEEAYIHGVHRFGNRAFLIRQVLEKQPVITIYSALAAMLPTPPQYAIG